MNTIVRNVLARRREALLHQAKRTRDQQAAHQQNADADAAAASRLESDAAAITAALVEAGGIPFTYVHPLQSPAEIDGDPIDAVREATQRELAKHGYALAPGAVLALEVVTEPMRMTHLGDAEVRVEALVVPQ